MNLKPEPRKRFLGLSHRLALVFAAVFAVIAIVGISQNLARVDPPTAPPGLALAPAKPLHLTGRLAPPPALLGRIVALEAAEDAPTTPFYDRSGQAVTLAALTGSGLVVNFWATWCAPCVKEMPALDSLAAQFEGRGVRVIAISEDRDAVPKVEAFYREVGIHNLAVYYDERGVLSRRLGIRGLPNTLLIDARGQAFGRVVGIAPWDDPAVVAYLARILAAAPPP